jgi:beta-lactamase regulating signal transducer with metallopeptidase domain
MLANAAVAVGLMAAAFGVAAARRPRAAHAAWLVVLLKLVTPPLVVVPVFWAATAKPAEKAPKPVESTPPPPEATGEVLPEPVDILPPVDAAQSEIVPVEPDPPVPAVLAEAAPVPVSEPVNPWRIATVVWLGGAAAYLGLVALRVVRFRRFVQTATPADAETLDLARDVAVRLGLNRVPAVRFVDGPVSPMLWAVVDRPQILLPRRLWAGFDPDHREAVLAHELAHLARGDHWTRRFELFVLALYWWCPVAWVAVRELRRAEEACCDARVLGAVPGRAAAYAEALVETIAFVNRPGWVPLASGGAVRASDLKRRVTMILNSNGPRANPWLPAVVFLIGVAVLPLAPGMADGPKAAPEMLPPLPDDPPPPPVPARPRELAPRGADDVRGRMRDDALMIPATDQSLPRSAPPKPPAADVGLLKDELELLEAQTQVKQAHVRAAERGVKSAERAFSLIKQGVAQGSVSQAELAHSEEVLEKAMSELDIRKAELMEHQVRVRQVARRVSADLPAPVARPAPDRAPSPSATPAPARNRNPDLAPVPSPRAEATTPAPVRPAGTPPAPRDPRPASSAPRPPVADPTALTPQPRTAVMEDRQGTRANIDLRLNQLMDQYERTQKEIQSLQKQQADLKKHLDELADLRKKYDDELPKPAAPSPQPERR